MLRGLGIGILLLFSLQTFGQEDRFYIRAVSEDIVVPVTAKDSVVTYVGDDVRLKEIFNKHHVKVFRKNFKYAERSTLKRTFFAIATTPAFKKELLEEAGDLFEFGESLDPQKLKIYEPNDYGATSTTGKAMGMGANHSYLDFLGVPQAWYYTTGNPEVIIGISDGYVDPEDPEFKGRLTVIQKSPLSKGHGFGVTAIAAASGDNGYGTTGICYNCNIYTTTYGNFSKLDQLLELGRKGAKVINCSWGLAKYYETAQEAINELRDMGTVVVSVPHNIAYSKTKGNRNYYPGAYEHVISVGTVQHTYDNVEDGLKVEEKNGKWYAEKQAYHLARNGGFKNNNPKEEIKLYLSSANNLDQYVDIVAPGTDIVRYYPYVETKDATQTTYNHTSPAAPLVTGTIGLMFSLNPCLSVDEINTLIKLSATNIDHIKPNKPLEGKYGAGALHTGRAVKMTHDMLTEKDTLLLENQGFTRWNFKLDAPHNIYITKEQFRDSARVDFTAKRQIFLGPDTVLLPDQKGSIHLKIDAEAMYNCNDSQE